MDDRRFDDLTRTLARGLTRRAAVKGGLAAILGAVGLRGHAAAQVTQVYCGNQSCASNPGSCKPGCVCCVYTNAVGQITNSRCRPPGTCAPGVVQGCPPDKPHTDPARGCVQCLNAGQCPAPAGACQVATCTNGVCGSAPATDGTPCNDGNACTQSDTCRAGACVGNNPVLCTALDQCHDVGTCDPSTGLCSNPNKADGAACNDGQSGTTNDTCQNGVCVGITCGGFGQTCCSGNLCNAGFGCIGGSCQFCGSPGEQCCAGDACDFGAVCNAGTCDPCGGAGDVCCPGDTCGPLAVCEEGFCQSCGGALESCCPDGTCAAGAFCTGGTCRPCGGRDEQCCPGGGCDNGHVCDQSGAVAICQVCGSANEHCCAGNLCQDGFACVGGACQVCGFLGDPCCPGDACDVGEVCDGGICKQDGCDYQLTCGSGETCIDNACCPSARICHDPRDLGGASYCCPAGQSCFNDACCPDDRICHDLNGPICCAAGLTCDEVGQISGTPLGVCCPAGAEACIFWAGGDGGAIGAGCCGAGEACAEASGHPFDPFPVGTCCPTGVAGCFTYLPEFGINSTVCCGSGEACTPVPEAGVGTCCPHGATGCVAESGSFFCCPSDQQCNSAGTGSCTTPTP